MQKPKKYFQALKTNMDKNLLFSVVICTYNRVDLFKLCLKSIINQSFDNKRFEVIVMDDRSKDQTQAAARQYQKKYSFRLSFRQRALTTPMIQMVPTVPIRATHFRKKCDHMSSARQIRRDGKCISQQSSNEIKTPYLTYRPTD